MAGEIAIGQGIAMPEGFAAVPIAPGHETDSLKICVLVRNQPDASGSRFLILRSTLDAMIYQGCITDFAGRVRQWVDLWVQNLDSIRTALPTAREVMTSDSLDQRWTSHARAFEAVLPRSVIVTGFEASNPAPTAIDLSTMKPVQLLDPDSKLPLQLCRDDAALSTAGLPKYSSTTHRYLWVPDNPDLGFFPVTQDAPKTQATRNLDPNTSQLAFNPAGGLMLVCHSIPLMYEAFVDFISGAAEEESIRAVDSVLMAQSFDRGSSADSQNAGWLFMGTHGRMGRLIEGFHLKLHAISQAVASVQQMVRQTQMPLLNLSPDSFRIQLGDPSPGLPWLWTAKVALVTPGDVIELPLKQSDSRHFLAAQDPGMSGYRPPTAGRNSRGRASVRIRRVLGDTKAPLCQVILEGTLATHDILHAGRHDLVWLRLIINNQRLDVYAHLEAQTALTVGEWRFRTLEQRLPQAIAEQLRSAEGAAFPDVMYDVLPLLNAPCDLYSLAVLAVRTLLVSGQRTLWVALDEIQSLAKQIAADAMAHSVSSTGQTPLPPLENRIESLFEKDKRWLSSLGPQNLAFEPMAPEDAFNLVPAELWWATLATIVRMFPGIGIDSESGDYGEGRPGGLHRVFDRSIADFQALLLKSRSLIVIDWQFNREIDAVLRGHLNNMNAVFPGATLARSPSGAAR